MTGELFATFVATVSFCVLFSAPIEEWGFCGVSGAVSWLVYQFFKYRQSREVIAVWSATIVLTVLANFLARWRKKPVIVYLLPGIFPLVPGAELYYTGYSLITNQLTGVSYYGMQTMETALAIALGILLASPIGKKNQVQ